MREYLGYDIARHVDATVHLFEEWGLPIMRDPEIGRYQREGKWQIMINGESYKPIVAEAARKAASEVYNRIMVTEGRIATKAAVNYVNDLKNEKLQVSDKQVEDLKKTICQPLQNYTVGRNEIVAGTVSPSYLLPIQGLQRLEKIMDEYVGGIGSNYMTNEPLLTRGLELLAFLKEDLNHIGAEDFHQLQRAWELQHRFLASVSVTQHTLFRKETRWPGYYYRGDHMKLDDKDWHCFTLSRYDWESDSWNMEKAPVYHIID